MKDIGTTAASTPGNQTTGDQRAVNAAHTPGPWDFGKTDEDRRIILGDAGNGRYVCNVQIYQTPRGYGLLDEAEREANARLIAAAPDLLAACKDCIEDRGDWMALMSAAIAKAEGH